MTHQTEEALKACPFCCSEAEENVFNVNLGHGDFREDYYIECSNKECRVYVRTPSCSPIDAANLWNNRALSKAEEVDKDVVYSEIIQAMPHYDEDLWVTRGVIRAVNHVFENYHITKKSGGQDA